MTFIPILYVRNRAGLYLAPHDGSGVNKLPVKWSRERCKAASFATYIEAADFRRQLPRGCSANIVDQTGMIWTPQHATRVGLFIRAAA